MKVAILSDIHGNSCALQRVLQIAKKEKVQKLLVLGDLVGYYYHPDKVMQLLSEWQYSLIKGNHEDLLAGILNGKIIESDLRKKYGSGHKLALEKLNKDTINTITTAPEQMNIELNKVRFLMCHGSPWDHDHYIYPDAEAEILNKCDRTDADFVVCGHSHYQFIHRNTHSTLINVGSVGQSRNMGGIANWVIVNTDNKSVEMKATPYDTSELEKEVKEVDPTLPYLHEILKRNRS